MFYRRRHEDDDTSPDIYYTSQNRIDENVMIQLATAFIIGTSLRSYRNSQKSSLVGLAGYL